MTQPTEGYDPQQDPDSDPEMLNPRSGAQASGGAPDGQDQDSDPDSMNPRDDG